MNMKTEHTKPAALLLVAFTLCPLPADDGKATRALISSLTFYASFDHGVDADRSSGDPRIYTNLVKRPSFEAKAGLHTEGLTRNVPTGGLSGGALQFTSKGAKSLFFKAEKNIAYSGKKWSGTVSLWLRLDPEEDLEPGFCDPIQITPRKWNDAAFFVDFDQAGDPRDFRLGAYADTLVWNPENKKLNQIPDEERPLVTVHNPPFGREKWTHVVFTWENFNTGKKNGVAVFYLDGKLKGKLEGREQTYTWKPTEKSRIMIGLNYIGLFDELACFDRALTQAEVNTLHDLRSGLSSVLVKE